MQTQVCEGLLLAWYLQAARLSGVNIIPLDRLETKTSSYVDGCNSISPASYDLRSHHILPLPPARAFLSCLTSFWFCLHLFSLAFFEVLSKNCCQRGWHWKIVFEFTFCLILSALSQACRCQVFFKDLKI